MPWEKSPPELVALFKAICPGEPVVTRPMFGYPCAFYAGNMFVGLFEDQLWVRLPEVERKDLFARGGGPFEPMKGRPMKEYVVVPSAWGPDELRPWVDKALAYATTLPPKPQHRTKKG